MGSVLAPLASVLVGAVLAIVTVVGVIGSQTGPPDRSPANSETPALEYGTASNSQ